MNRSTFILTTWANYPCLIPRGLYKSFKKDVEELYFTDDWDMLHDTFKKKWGKHIYDGAWGEFGEVSVIEVEIVNQSLKEDFI